MTASPPVLQANQSLILRSTLNVQRCPSVRTYGLRFIRVFSCANDALNEARRAHKQSLHRCTLSPKREYKRQVEEISRLFSALFKSAMRHQPVYVISLFL